MSLSDLTILIFGILMILIAVYISYVQIKKHDEKSLRRNKLIRVPMMKIFHNPFIDKMMWTRFNPKTRTWEWFMDALPNEVEKYSGLVYSEEEGMKIICDNRPFGWKIHPDGVEGEINND